MPKFIVNKNAQSNGDHEVHNATEGCNYMPDKTNQKDLDYHDNCTRAVKEAKKYYNQVNGCYYCCYDCHTQ